MALLDQVLADVLARPRTHRASLDAVPAIVVCAVAAALFALQASRSGERKYYVTVAVFVFAGVACFVGGATGELEW